ncbi:MAG: hypothetical protein WC997_00220 [Porticoccaceae bacterium]
MNFLKALLLCILSLFTALFVWAEDSSDALPLLWSEGHKANVEMALSLRETPELIAMRKEVIGLYENTSSGRLADGKARIEAAVDELIFGVILTTITPDPAHPAIVWNETLPYTAAGIQVPGSRYAGDMPDRLYRNIVVDPSCRYELRGRLDGETTLDFSIEALPGPANWGLPPLAILQSKDIVVGDDGSFTITLDASPPRGRINHLQLPPGTISLLVRDTLLQWDKQKPVVFDVHGLDESAPLSSASMVNHAADQLRQSAEVSMGFYEAIWQRAANTLDPYVRDLGWGIVAINRFQIADDEALVVILDPLSARYLSLQVDDLWLRSTDYVTHTSTLNNAQAKPNHDGTFTFVVAKRDPGYFNWIDTDGMNDGYLIGRWELLTHVTTGENAVREVRKVKLAELGAILPEDVFQVSPNERAAQIGARKTAYQLRLGKY